MLIYLLVFLSSSLLIVFGENSVARNKFLDRIQISIGLLLPAILAGVRDKEIGTDVQVYGMDMFWLAGNVDSFFEYQKKLSESILSEPLYNAIVYFSSLVSTDFHFSLFIVNIAANIFMYMGCMKLKKKYGIHTWLVMLLYYLYFYNQSLNLMRQVLAMSVVFFATACLINNEKKKSIFYFILSMFLHTSAIISLSILPVYAFLKEKEGRRSWFAVIKILLIFTVAIVVIQALTIVVPYLVSLGLLRPNYLKYLNGNAFGSGQTSTTLLMFDMLFLIMHLPLIIKRKRLNLPVSFFVTISLLSILIAQLTVISTFIVRAGYYFSLIQIMGIASVSRVIYNKYIRVVAVSFILAIMSWYWIYYFAIRGYCETIPYSSEILQKLIIR